MVRIGASPDGLGAGHQHLGPGRDVSIHPGGCMDKTWESLENNGNEVVQ